MLLKILLVVYLLSCCSAQLIGEIKLMSSSYVPEGWMLCEGQLLSIELYPALFERLGTIYGGDGRESFSLPDFRGRSFVFGDQDILKGGAETATLTSANLPSHSHDVRVYDGEGEQGNADDAYFAASSESTFSSVSNAENINMISIVGSGQSFSIMPPSLVLNIMIYIGKENELAHFLVPRYAGEIYLSFDEKLDSNTKICNGSDLSISQYPDLFEAIGYSYGGNSDLFSIPDLTQRMVVGSGSGPGLTPRTLASKFGSNIVALSTANLAAHTHILKFFDTDGGENSPVDNFLSNSDDYWSSEISSGTMASDSIISSGVGEEFKIFPPYLSLSFNIVTKNGLQKREHGTTSMTAAIALQNEEYWTLLMNDTDIGTTSGFNIKDRFIFGCSTPLELGLSGGSSTHILTLDQMPAHSHGLKHHLSGEDPLTPSTVSVCDRPTDDFSSSVVGESLSGVGSTGDSAPFDIIPPFQKILLMKYVHIPEDPQCESNEAFSDKNSVCLNNTWIVPNESLNTELSNQILQTMGSVTISTDQKWTSTNLTVRGNLDFSSSMSLRSTTVSIRGNFTTGNHISMNDNSTIVVSGYAHLSGSLEISISTSKKETIDLIKYNSHKGTFDQVDIIGSDCYKEQYDSGLQLVYSEDLCPTSTSSSTVLLLSTISLLLLL